MAVVFNSFTFLEQPRTGSTAVRRALIKLGGIAQRRHSFTTGPVLVATVRDPYDLIVAHWLNSGIKWGYRNIDSYVRECDRSLFVRSGLLYYHAVVAHKLLRFDSLEADLNSFLAAMGLPLVTLDRVNVTGPSLVLSDTTRGLIDARFKGEIEWVTPKLTGS